MTGQTQTRHPRAYRLHVIRYGHDLASKKFVYAPTREQAEAKATKIQAEGYNPWGLRYLTGNVDVIELATRQEVRGANAFYSTEGAWKRRDGRTWSYKEVWS